MEQQYLIRLVEAYRRGYERRYADDEEKPEMKLHYFKVKKDLPIDSVPVLANGTFNSRDEILGYLGDSKYISKDHIANLRREAERLGLDADRIVRETDSSRTMEGIYIKVEENGEVVDRIKFVRNSFLQTEATPQGNWLYRPIIPNLITRTLDELFI